MSWFAWPHDSVLSSPENVSAATVCYLCCFVDTAGFISLGNLLILIFHAKSSFPIFRLYHFYYNDLWEVLFDIPRYHDHHAVIVIWIKAQAYYKFLKVEQNALELFSCT